MAESGVPVVDTTVRVRYAETDAQGVAYHGNYFVWFEVGRSEYFRAVVGDGPGGFFSSYGMPLTEAGAKYHVSCRYDDLLVIRTRIAELRSRSIRFVYEVRSAADPDRLLAEGHTAHVCVNSTGRPCLIPRYVREPLAGRP